MVSTPQLEFDLKVGRERGQCPQWMSEEEFTSKQRKGMGVGGVQETANN